MSVNGKIKIAIISHALVIPVFQNRWKRLAQDEKYEVHLIVPEHWEQTWFAEKVTYYPEEVHAGNFHLHPLPTTSRRDWTKFFFKSWNIKLSDIKPDVIYIVHGESALIHYQIYLYRMLFCPKAKICFFSMNARGVPFTQHSNKVKRFVLRFLWERIKKNTDIALVHYPGCLKSLRDGGYNKPIYLQTQVGVDEALFKANNRVRQEIRDKLNFQDSFILGYTGRLTKDKGVDDIFNVFKQLKKQNKNVSLLLVGNGELRENLEKEIKKLNLEKSVYITGFVDQSVVPDYMNAMDVFILGSRTTPHWIDTFPLVTVQAQSVGVPVVASDSASIPWQLAETGLIYREGDRKQLYEYIDKLLNNENLRKYLVDKGRKRSHDYFCHVGMTDNFKKIIEQLLNNKIVYHKNDEAYLQWKAY